MAHKSHDDLLRPPIDPELWFTRSQDPRSPEADIHPSTLGSELAQTFSVGITGFTRPLERLPTNNQRFI